MLAFITLRSVWFEAATVVSVPPPVEISAENVLKSALAGGLASALSTSFLHPIDTMKVKAPIPPVKIYSYANLNVIVVWNLAKSVNLLF